MKNIKLPLFFIVLFSSCVAKKKFFDLQSVSDTQKALKENYEKELAQKNADLESQKGKNKDMENQLEYLKKTTPTCLTVLLTFPC